MQLLHRVGFKLPFFLLVSNIFLLILSEPLGTPSEIKTGKIPTWADPPSPSMGIFSTKYRFFLKMSQSEKIKKIVNYVLAPQDDFGMQKKLGKQT